MVFFCRMKVKQSRLLIILILRKIIKKTNKNMFDIYREGPRFLSNFSDVITCEGKY